MGELVVPHEEVIEMGETTSGSHMWLLAAGVALALLFGWGLGWAVAFAVIGCGAMLAAVFWIGRGSVQQGSGRAVDPDEAVERR